MARWSRHAASDLATGAGVPLSSGLRMIAAIEGAGLARRTIDERDRRRSIVRLTEAGAEKMASYFDKMNAAVRGGYSRAKAFETRRAVEDGAKEIDMVINIDLLKSQDLAAFEEDIRAVRRATQGATILKVILETCLLKDEEKVLACEIAKKAGADFVKTSTGFSTGGATVEDVALMRRVVGAEIGVKASGGIRDYAKAVAMIQAGANRLGTSASVAIVTGASGSGTY